MRAHIHILYLVPDLENTASLFAGQFLNPMDLAIISSEQCFLLALPALQAPKSIGPVGFTPKIQH